MFEEMLANLSLTPTTLVIAGATATLSLWLGWSFRGFGIRRREAGLKNEVLVAKASVPQLESDVRNRDNQIQRIQQHIEELKEDNTTLSQRTDEAEKELRSAQRQVSNLTSEVNAVKGVSKDVDNMIIDGFDDERAHEDADASPLAARLRKTEAAYEKLKGALIKRDDRIDDLEEKLHAAKQEGGNIDPTEGVGEQHALQADVDNARSTISDLQAQLLDSRQEKEMLEELANRRSKTNRALKDATAKAKEQVPALHKQIEEHTKTIGDREASISRLLKDVESTKLKLNSEQNKAQKLEQELATNVAALDAAQARTDTVKLELDSREQRISQLDGALAKSADSIANLNKQLEAADGLAELHQQTVDDLADVRRQKQDMAEVIEVRNRKLASLSANLDQLGVELAAAREQSTEVAATAERKCAEADAQTAEREAEVRRLKLELEDVGATLAQQERWMAKLKKSLSDREALGTQLEQQVEALAAQLNSTNAELQYQQVTQEVLEAEKRASEERAQTLQEQSERAHAELAKVELELARTELQLGGEGLSANLDSAPLSQNPSVSFKAAEVVPIKTRKAVTCVPSLYSKASKGRHSAQSRAKPPKSAKRKGRASAVVRMKGKKRQKGPQARPVRLHNRAARFVS